MHSCDLVNIVKYVEIKKKPSALLQKFINAYQLQDKVKSY